MKRNKKRGAVMILTLLLMATTVLCQAQPEWLEGELVVQSRHAWRGEIMGEDIAIEPSVTFSTGRFSFNVWAALTPDNSYSELDLIPSYRFDWLTVSVLDYYNPVAGEDNNFWTVKDNSRHSVEITLDNFDVEKQRLKWLAGTFVLGDRNDDTGRPLYSTYLEISYPFEVLGIEATPFVGGTPWAGYYATEASLVNTGLTLGKELALGSIFTIPLSVSAVYNPYNHKHFVTFAAGIAF